MRALLVLLLTVLLLPTTVVAATAGDAEASSHGDEAARWSVIDHHVFPGLEIVQFELPVLSIYSYVVVSDGEALVVDPGRDAQAFVDYLAEKKLRAKGVWLTHSHADFVAGHTELRKALGAKIYANEKADAAYPHESVREGSVIELGKARIEFLATPGHTPDALTALVYGPGSTRPRAALTGDFLFVGSVGRPDLLGGLASASWLAGAGWHSWTDKLSKVGDEALVLPAHGAGSLCGANLSDASSSTIGEQKKSNRYLQFKSKNEYVAAILTNQPKAPEYFGHDVAMNREGPKLVDWKAPLPAPFAPRKDFADAGKFWVLDLRDARHYAKAHVPYSVNIGLRGRLETWVGNMVPWGTDPVLVGSHDEVFEARNRLHRIGYEAKGWIDFDAWEKAGLPVRSTKMIEPRDLYASMQSGTAPLIIDVRLPAEWMGLRIGTVLNLPLDELGPLSRKLDRDENILTICNSAYRSSMGVGVLEREGFRNLSNLTGGGEAWQKAGLPVIQAAAHGADPAPAQRRIVHLPDRISPDDLRRMMMDLPNSFDLVDLRPAEHFADYHLPGAKNVHVVDLLDDPTHLAGAGPLVLVCRDGSLSAMAGAILSQKTKRIVKVLHGGLEAYWNGVAAPGRSASPSGPPSSAAPGAPVLPQAAPVAPAAPAAPAAPKRRSAGC